MQRIFVSMAIITVLLYFLLCKPEPVAEPCLSGTASGMVVWSKTSPR